ncbi:phosphonate transporter [Longibacter salinarum]|uniref:Phosphonate transporter n=1 Tax=Longibacter salinarum TaxID=1850348 RepID=A0A2A8D0U1_9BACT|nr:PAS domain-containing protein [Longibacter salinarum]PEN14582.1 phosphonate transporter [Longibacter salinarum]
MADDKNKKYPFLDADTDESMNASNGHASDDTVNDTELHFEDDQLGEKLRHQDKDTLDQTDFGVIKVDDEGIVEFFNQWESDLSGVKKEEAEGRNFFTQVAPCTNNRLFRGRFKKGVRRGELDESFTYTYTYKMRPTLVEVHMYRDEESNNWIIVQKF